MSEQEKAQQAFIEIVNSLLDEQYSELTGYVEQVDEFLYMKGQENED